MKKKFLTKIKISPIVKNTNKILLFTGFIVLLNLLYPNPFMEKFNLRVGEVATRDIIAPHTFYIKKDKKEIEEEIKKINEDLIFLLDKKDNYNEIKEELSKFFSSLENMSTKEKKDYIKKIIPNIDDNGIRFLIKNRKNIKDNALVFLKDILSRGVIISKEPISSPYIEIKEEGVSSTSIKNKEDIIQLSQINEMLANMYKDSCELKIFIGIINHFIKPNITINYNEMEKRKEEMMQKISPTKGIVLKGEMIVRAHDIITKEAIEKLNSMRLEGKEFKFKKAIGRNILYLIGIFILLFSIYLFKPAIWGDFKKTSVIIIIILINMAIFSLIMKFNLPKYIIPIGGVGLLMGLLVGGEGGICSIISIPIFVIAYSGGDIESIILVLFIGILSVLISFKIKKITEFYKTTLYFIAGYIISVCGLELFKLSPGLYIIKFVGWAIVGGISSSFITFVLLPLFEKIFKLTTPITLLDYADSNHPLLQDLARYAPGTYNHSMAVAQLAESAARAIKADTLLTKVGAYFHDIGKIKKPDYFIENIMPSTENNNILHKKNISPELYAIVLLSHVKEGAELAKERGLPNEIVNIIKEHHGTTLIEYFFKKAKINNEKTQEIDFRYPGPLPSTKESAIIMLADAVESATRALDKVNPNKLNNLVENILKKRLEDGQLSKVNLTMDELNKIQKAFLPVLLGIFHQRIQY